MTHKRKFRLLLLSVAALTACPAPAACGATPKNALDGTITLSNKQKAAGKIFMTRGKMLRLFDPKFGEYRDFKLKLFSRITVNCVRKRTEREWYFKEEGNPEKIYTGRQYPRLDFTVTVLFKKGGRKLTSNIVRGQPIYVQPEKGKKKRYILQPYLRGEMGQTPEQLVYMKEIVFGKPEDTKKKPDGNAKKKENATDKKSDAAEDRKKPEKKPDTPEITGNKTDPEAKDEKKPEDEKTDPKTDSDITDKKEQPKN